MRQRYLRTRVCCSHCSETYIVTEIGIIACSGELKGHPLYGFLLEHTLNNWHLFSTFKKQQSIKWVTQTHGSDA